MNGDGDVGQSVIVRPPSGYNWKQPLIRIFGINLLAPAPYGRCEGCSGERSAEAKKEYAASHQTKKSGLPTISCAGLV